MWSSPVCDWSLERMLACDWLLLTRRLVSPWSGRGRVSLCVTNLVSCLLTSLIISHEKLWEWKHFSQISDTKTNQSWHIRYFSYFPNPSSLFRNPFLSPFTRLGYLLKYVLSLIAGTEMMSGMQAWHSSNHCPLIGHPGPLIGHWHVTIAQAGGDIMTCGAWQTISNVQVRCPHVQCLPVTSDISWCPPRHTPSSFFWCPRHFCNRNH